MIATHALQSLVGASRILWEVPRRPRSRLLSRLLEATLEAAVSAQRAAGRDELTKDLESKLGTATKASQDDRPLADKPANYRGDMSLQGTRGYMGG